MAKDSSNLRDALSELSVRDPEDQIIISLDFGTTYSGIAFAFSYAERPDVLPITEWPGLEGYPAPKTPTQISYATNGKGFTWGAQKHDSPPLIGMKLLLDPEQEKPLYVPGKSGKQELNRLGKSAEQIVTDYLRSIYGHALSKIESKTTKSYFDSCEKKFVVTVPAVWSDKAKQSTLQAAKAAGIHPVTLVTEPEAAALYTLHVMDRALSEDDAFVICDAGGGTVDLISYEVKQLSPRLELGELVPSKGGMAGSLVLNKRFEQAVTDLIGEEEFFILKKKVGWEEAMKNFDRHIKTAYRGGSDETHLVSFPMAKLRDDPTNGLEGNTWAMKGSNLYQIFVPLITDIIKLVEDQVNQIKVKRLADNHPKKDQIKAIFLVGGFGSSQYLKQCLEKKFAGIQIIQPPDAWSAIVKGAVLSQLPAQVVVKTSIAKKHYGVSARQRYEKYRDAGQEKKWSAVDGFYRVHRMSWYIYQNEDLERDKRIAFPFYRTLSAGYTTSDLIFKDELLSSEELLPPAYPHKGTTNTYCTVCSDLTSYDKSVFEERRGADGNTYYNVNYNLTLTTVSAGFRFALEIDDKDIGSVEAKFE